MDVANTYIILRRRLGSDESGSRHFMKRDRSLPRTGIDRAQYGRTRDRPILFDPNQILIGWNDGPRSARNDDRFFGRRGRRIKGIASPRRQRFCAARWQRHDRGLSIDHALLRVEWRREQEHEDDGERSHDVTDSL